MLENTIAVEMEGIGAGLAASQSQAEGHRVSFLMIRSISDVPDGEKKPRGETQSGQRASIKPCAAAIAAAFTVSYIRSGLPTPPIEGKTKVVVIGEKGSEIEQELLLRHLSEINSARFKAQQAILKWQNADGGIAATRPGQESGPWTTASCLEALLDGPSIVPGCVKCIQGMVDYLIKHQHGDGSWPMLKERESCTLATGHAVSALMAARSSLVPRDDSLIQQVIHDGMKWLRANRLNSGGWSIATSNRGDAPKPRISATYYALRPFLRDTSGNPGNIVQKAISWMASLRKSDGSLPATQTPTRPGLSNTARYLISVVRSRDYELSQTFYKLNQKVISSGFHVMIKNKPRTMKAWPADIESYFPTGSSTQSTVHNNVTCDVLEALIRCRCSYSQIIEPVEWLVKGQSEDGSWRLQSPDENPDIFPAQTWSTSEFLYVLNLVALRVEEELHLR